MNEKLVRVGTIYIPVNDVEKAAEWYVTNLGAQLSYIDEDKAIINMANQSFFLVKAKENETLNFFDHHGEERFTLTFEVDGLIVLQRLHSEFIEKGVRTGEIEDRGHKGRNFIFFDVDGNKFDVWSELSPNFKR